MRRRPPRSTPLYSSAASDVYKRQVQHWPEVGNRPEPAGPGQQHLVVARHLLSQRRHHGPVGQSIVGDEDVCQVLEQGAVHIEDGAWSANDEPVEIGPQPSQCGESVRWHAPRDARPPAAVDQVHTEPGLRDSSVVLVSAAHTGILRATSLRHRAAHLVASASRSRTSYRGVPRGPCPRKLWMRAISVTSQAAVASSASARRWRDPSAGRLRRASVTCGWYFWRATSIPDVVAALWQWAARSGSERAGSSTSAYRTCAC